MRYLLVLSVILALAMTFGFVTGCSEDVLDATDISDYFPDSEYAGTETCKECHTSHYADFIDSGHSYKLNKVVNAAAPTYPYTVLPDPPNGMTWDQITYVIGGYGWKAQFMGTDGYIVTAGGNNQWNVETSEWVDYHADEQKPYDCGICHTTGFEETGHQDGLEGIEGTWVMAGVQCESCHGPGDNHVANPIGSPMVIDRDSAACGECHIRGSKYKIPAKGDMEQHHEQWNEHFNSPMAENLACVDCHNPHKRVINGGAETAMKVNCDDCHNQQLNTYMTTGYECTDCHMPELARSAVGDASAFDGDVHSHLWNINIDENAEQFYDEDGSQFVYPYITLDFACLVCHTTQDRAWAATNASLVHQ